MLILRMSSPLFLLQLPPSTAGSQRNAETPVGVPRRPLFQLFSASTPRHRVSHNLPTVPDPPVFAKARRLNPGKLASTKAEFLKMEKAGIVRRSSSPWSSTLRMVSKPDGTWKPCGDMRGLNNTTVPDRYPLPAVADFSARILF